MKPICLAAILLCFLAVPLAGRAAAVSQGTQAWPHGEVPYRIAPELLKKAGAARNDCTGWRRWKSGQAAMACKAMEAWHAATGIRFYPDAWRLDAVDIIRGGGTDGTVGHWPVGNRIHIEAAPRYGAVLHEFGHVLGLMHEHQRPDRDQYLTLSPFLRDDLKACQASAFVCADVKLAFPTMAVAMSSPYDPCSLMHYLADQTPRHREDPRWGRIYDLTPKGEAALKACAVQFAKLPARCRRPGQKCAISRDDADIVRRFNGL